MGCYGQDWASYQSPAPDVTGLSFVFVKATEGLTYVNPRWAAQTAYARLHKLAVGHYHYPHMGSDPGAEADRFLAVAQPQAGDLLVLDWEGYDAANKGVSVARQIAYKNAWLSRVRGAMPRHQVGTYCNTDYLDQDPRGAYGDFLWIATAGKAAGQPGISQPWMFHQYSAGSVDKDFCPVSAANLAAWAHLKEDDMPLTDAEIEAVALRVLAYRNADADAASVKAGHGHIPDFYGYVVDTNAKLARLATGGVDMDALAVKVADLLAARLKS